MKYLLIFSIAKSLLLARWKQTLIAAIGVTFSITMFVTLLSFMNGLNDMLDGLVLNRTPHVRLFNEIKPNEIQPVNIADEYVDYHHFISSVKSVNSRQEIYNSGAVVKQINNDPRVLGYAPKITAQVFFNDGTIDITGVVNGIDVEAESRLFFFTDYVTSGKAIDLKNVPNSIILGKGLADKLLAEIGDVVQVITARGDRISLKVVGYFQSGLHDYDKVQSFASIATVQKLMLQPNNYVTDINVKLKDMALAPAIAKEYAQLFSTEAEDIQTANAQFETGTFIRNLISYAVGITLLVVAGFGIYNILNMMIYEKMDSIAILKATGFSGSDVNKVFLVIALSIGFFGGMFGLLFGFLLTLAIDQVPFNTSALPTITTYPVSYNPAYYIIGTVFSLVTTYFAGWFPARKASKIDPVIIIRGK
jgi:lipoprotein-releasing system permease protein